MSIQYDVYLEQHKAYVNQSLYWLQQNIPDLFTTEYESCILNMDHINHHDLSKNSPEEYDAYDKYFYGKNRSYDICKDFDYAWLNHIHKNPHHWQHWILFEDDPNSRNMFKALEMPKEYVIEMICDWWSFSWSSGNLNDIFDWYDQHSTIMILHPNTRKLVEDILKRMKAILEKNDETV